VRCDFAIPASNAVVSADRLILSAPISAPAIQIPSILGYAVADAEALSSGRLSCRLALVALAIIFSEQPKTENIDRTRSLRLTSACEAQTGHRCD
jgi:hypothetical protein